MEEEDQLVDSHDDIVVNVVQEILEQIQYNIDAFDFQHLNGVYAIFLAELMKYRLINKAKEQCGFPYQLEMQHNWHGPVVIYMDSWLSKGFILLEFGIKVEYALQIKFLFSLLNSSLISIYLQKVVTISWMLSWLHWKYDYTLLGCFYRLEVGVSRRTRFPYEHVDSFQYVGLQHYLVSSEVCVQNLKKLQRFGK